MVWPAWDGELAVVFVLSVLFTLPIWIGTHPPMADYPQHLSMASVLRWYHDPARHLAESYTFALTRPNTIFVVVVAALSYIMPLAMAGKLVMAATVVATGLAGLALARHTGRPGWFGLFALLIVYNFACWFGFVNNVIATPLFLYGIVIIDRLLDRPLGFHSWLILAAMSCAFYFVHLMFLFLFACAVGWLTLTRHRSLADSLWRFSTQVIGVAMVLFYYFLRHEETYGYHEKNIFSTQHESALIFDKLIQIPKFLFGAHEEGGQWLVFGFFVLAILLLCRFRLRKDPVNEPAGQAATGALAGRHLAEVFKRTRFGSLAGWFFAAYLLMPHIFVGVFIYQRLIAIACLLLPALLPLPDPRRLGPAKLVLAGAFAGQLLFSMDTALTYDHESRGGHELIAKTRPGKNLMALMLRPGSEKILFPPLNLHFGSYYLAEKGGRVYFSFSELHISPVQLRRELGFDDQDASMNEWLPGRFRFDDFGYHYDYFLYCGDTAMLQRLFNKHLGKLDWEARDDWLLLWRKGDAVAPR